MLGACSAGAIQNGIAQRVADFTHSVVYAPKGYGETSYGGPLNSPYGRRQFNPHWRRRPQPPPPASEIHSLR